MQAIYSYKPTDRMGFKINALLIILAASNFNFFTVARNLEDDCPPEVLYSTGCSPCRCEFKQTFYVFSCFNVTLNPSVYESMWDMPAHFVLENADNLLLTDIPDAKKDYITDISIVNSTMTRFDTRRFRNLKHLVVLNAEVLESSVLEIPSTLKILNITNSKLRNFNVPEVSNLTEVDLSGNVFEIIYAFPELQHLRMRHNNIRGFATCKCSPMQNLLTLDLSFNLIFHIFDDAFLCLLVKRSKTSIDIDFSYNNIEHINPDAFKGYNISKIDLSHNYLKTLDMGIVRMFPNLKYLNFEFNPWLCTQCQRWMLDVVDAMKKTNATGLINMRCHSPEKLYNETIVSFIHSDESNCTVFSSDQLNDIFGAIIGFGSACIVLLVLVLVIGLYVIFRNR